MKPRFVSLLTALLLLLAGPLAAQFNGPGSTTVGSEVNRPTTLTVDQALLFPGTRELVLTPGDLITLRLFGQPDYAPNVRIGNDGQVLLPLLGLIKLEGLSVTDAERLIARRLQEAGMYVDPQVTLQVLEGPNAVVTVVGEAHGVVPVAGSRRLFDILSSAGGLPATASHVVTINRPGLAEPLVVDLGSDPLRSALGNIPVFGGDTVIVGRIGVVYMVGSFKTTGTIALTAYSPLTLIEATSLSGGTLPDAKFGDLRLIRTVGDHRTVVKLDAKAVLYGKAADPILQPNDIIFLPNSALKGLIQSAGIGSLFGIASIAISLATR